MTAGSRAFLLLFLAGLVATTPAAAQSARSGSDSARVMQQMQQLAAERTALQAENAKLSQEVESLKARLAKLEGEQGALERRAQASEARAAQLTSTSETTGAALERAQDQLQELIGRFRETAQTLQDVESDRNALRSALAAKEREFAVCVDRNVGLYELNGEILDRLENRGFWSSLKESEPFTRIARTRLENLIDDYRYRVDELRMERATEATASAGAK